MLLLATTFAIALFSCANSAGGGGGANTHGPSIPNGENGGETINQTPLKYTITFNANDGSENPATVSQEFTSGTIQPLKTISELGFTKKDSYFAGWLTEKNATTATYTDGANYNATSNATLYAKWSKTPVYDIITYGSNGKVTANHAYAAKGTEITLNPIPDDGYIFTSYSAKTQGGNIFEIVDNKFIMPASTVYINAKFTALEYTISFNKIINGSITAYSNGSNTAYSSSGSNLTTSTVGTRIKLDVVPFNGYQLDKMNVIDANNSSIEITEDSNNPKRYYYFIMPAKNVTISATFVVITAANGEYTELESGTNGTFGTNGDYVTFGLWPQTIKQEGITINENDTETHGEFTYCRGSDGEWYVKTKERGPAKLRNAKYSNGTSVALENENSYKWFKIEPIKWRVITTNYDHDSNAATEGKKLLLAENVLTNYEFYDFNSVNRTFNGTITFPNQYQKSKIRAYLNGLAYTVKENDNAEQTKNNNFINKGILQSAFTENEQSKIVITTIINDALSANPNDKTSASQWHNGENPYATGSYYGDKIFLLSVQEATKSEYGFKKYNVGNDSGLGNYRIRIPTDFAKANGAYCETQSHDNDGYRWHLRSPAVYGDGARNYTVGQAGEVAGAVLVTDTYGIVPALCIK